MKTVNAMQNNKLFKKERKAFSILTIVIVVASLALAIYFLGNDRTKAAVEVIKDNTEDRLVDTVGKIEIAEKLAIKRIENIKKKLIKVKATKRSILRIIEEPKLSESQKQRYKNLIIKLDEVDTRATKAYKRANQNFKELRATLEILDTEIEISKTTASILGNNYTHTTQTKDLEKTIKSVYDDLDKANAELDVAIMDSN